jgi:hypothetical protein
MKLFSFLAGYGMDAKPQWTAGSPAFFSILPSIYQQAKKTLLPSGVVRF